MKIYVASSWRNEFQPHVVTELRADGHDVYDFRNPPNKSGFGWEQVDTGWREHPTDVKRYFAMLDHPIAEAGFDADMGALRSCDVCIYVGPAGSSAGLEFGWACGNGKLTIAYLPAIREPELMFKMAELLTDDFELVRNTLLLGEGRAVAKAGV